VVDPYSGAGVNGVTVTFSAKSGTFSPASGVSMTNSSGISGIVSTTYTLPKTAGAVTITAALAGGASVSFTETAVPGPATKLVNFSGTGQSGQAGSILPKPLEIKVEDASSNAVAGVPVTFVDKSGLGTLSSTRVTSNASGLAVASYQLPNTAGAYKITATAVLGNPPKTVSATFAETSTGDAPASISVVSGNNQTAAVNTPLSQPLVVQINDQGGNPVAGVSVVFSAPSGTFTGSPATTDSNGQATVNYTTGTSAGVITITASVDNVNTQMSVAITAGAQSEVTISEGSN
jgi:hypothetical protein